MSMDAEYSLTNINATAIEYTRTNIFRYAGKMDGSALTAERLRDRMEEVAIDQPDLARLAGVQQSTISNILTDRTRESRKLPAIARALAVNIDWLMGNTDHKIEMLDDDSEHIDEDEYRRRLQAAQGDAGISEDASKFANELGLVKVEEIDLSYGMGAAFVDHHVETIDRWIPGEWVSRVTSGRAGRITIMQPRGDSMYPTINDSDIVFIDRSRTSIDEQDSIWAVVYSGMGTIKRVRAMPDGSFVLSGDNAVVRDAVAIDGEMFVIGRVVGVIRRL